MDIDVARHCVIILKPDMCVIVKKINFKKIKKIKLKINFQKF